jgi:hypothetical protein
VPSTIVSVCPPIPELVSRQIHRTSDLPKSSRNFGGFLLQYKHLPSSPAA